MNTVLHSTLPEWLNIQQTAKYLNVSVAFIRKCVRRKSIPFVRIGTKVLRFRISELENWIETSGCAGETHSKNNGR